MDAMRQGTIPMRGDLWSLRESREHRRTRTKAFGVFAVLVGCLAIVLASCSLGSKGTGSSGNTTLLQPVADAQQVFHGQIVGVKDLPTLDPALAQDRISEEQVQMIFPPLVTLNAAQQVIPWAVTALPTVSNGGMTYTFHLRAGLKWSDGAAITADDFAYAINRAEDPCVASPIAYYLYDLTNAQDFNLIDQCVDPTHDTISGPIPTLIGPGLAIVVVDPQTLQLNLNRPAPYFLSVLTYSIAFAVPKHLIVNADGSINTNWTQTLASMPGGFGGNLYTITRWTHGKEITFTRNPHFWGHAPILREIDLIIYPNAGAAYRAFQSGSDDVGQAPTEAQGSGHANFHQYPLMQIDYLATNWALAPFNDLRVRQAFAIALDKGKLAQPSNGAFLPTNHIIPQGMPGYNPALTGPDGTQNLSGDTGTARALAQTYANEQCHGSFARCPAVQFTIVKGNKAVANEANAAIAMWQTAFPGWHISLNQLDAATYTTKLTLKDFQLWYGTWIGDYPDPEDVLSLQFLPENSYDGIGDDTVADGLMRAADVNPSPKQRLLEYQQAEQAEVNDVAWIPLDQLTGWYETNSSVANYAVAPTGLTPLPTWQTVFIGH